MGEGLSFNPEKAESGESSPDDLLKQFLDRQIKTDEDVEIIERQLRSLLDQKKDQGITMVGMGLVGRVGEYGPNSKPPSEFETKMLSIAAVTKRYNHENDEPIYFPADLFRDLLKTIDDHRYDLMLPKGSSTKNEIEDGLHTGASSRLLPANLALTSQKIFEQMSLEDQEKHHQLLDEYLSKWV